MEKMSITSNPCQKAEQRSEGTYESSQLLKTALSLGTLTVASNNNSISGAISGGPFGASGSLAPTPPVRSVLLDSEVFGMPVAALCDLWLVKHGNDWVDADTLMNDSFWALAYARLKSLGELEVHFLSDRSRYVCRKPR
jgi:hypothetical protein